MPRQLEQEETETLQTSSSIDWWPTFLVLNYYSTVNSWLSRGLNLPK